MRRRVHLCFVLAAMFAVALSGLAQKKPPAKPIDLNTATVEQLQQLPGVGPVIAKSIFDFRKKSGPFRRPEDLLAIRGISENRYKAIAPYVVVTPAKLAVPPKAAVAAPAKPPAPPRAAAPGAVPTPKPAAPSR